MVPGCGARCAWLWLSISVWIQTDAANVLIGLRSTKNYTEADEGFTNWKQPYHSAGNEDLTSDLITRSSSAILEASSSLFTDRERNSPLSSFASQPYLTVLANDGQFISTLAQAFDVASSQSPDNAILSSMTSSFISLHSSIFEDVDSTTEYFSDAIMTSLPFTNDDFYTSLTVSDVISPTAAFHPAFSTTVYNADSDYEMTSEPSLFSSQFPYYDIPSSPHPASTIFHTTKSLDTVTNSSLSLLVDVSTTKPTHSNDSQSDSSNPEDSILENTTETILEAINATTSSANNNTVNKTPEKITYINVDAPSEPQTAQDSTTAKDLTTANKHTTISSSKRKYRTGYDITNSSYLNNNHSRTKQAVYLNNLTSVHPTSSRVSNINHSSYSQPTSSLNASTDSNQFTVHSPSDSYTTTAQYKSSLPSLTSTLPFLESTSVLQSASISSVILESNPETSTSTIASNTNLSSSLTTPFLSTINHVSSLPDFDSFTPVVTSSSQAQTSEGGYVLTVMFSIDPALFDNGWKPTQPVYVEPRSISPEENAFNAEEISEVDLNSTILDEYDADLQNIMEVGNSSSLPTDMQHNDLALSEDPIHCNCNESESKGGSCNCNDTMENETVNPTCNCDITNASASSSNSCSCTTENLEIALQAVINKSILPHFRSGANPVPINFEVKLKPTKGNGTKPNTDPGSLWFLMNPGNTTQSPHIPFICTCTIYIKPNRNPSSIQCGCNDITTTTNLPTTTLEPSTEPPCDCTMPEELRPLSCECNDTEMTTPIQLCPCLNLTQYFCNCTLRPPPCTCDEIKLATGVFLRYNCQCSYDIPTPAATPMQTLDWCYCEKRSLDAEIDQLLNCTCTGTFNRTLILLSSKQKAVSSTTEMTLSTTSSPKRLGSCNGNDVEIGNGIFLSLKCRTKPATTTTAKPVGSNQCVQQEIRISDEVSLKIKTSCNILEKYFGVPTRKPVDIKPTCSCVSDELVARVVNKLSCSCFRDGVIKNMTIIMIAPQQVKRSQHNQKLSSPTVTTPSCVCEEIKIQSSLVLKVNCDCPEPPTSTSSNTVQTLTDAELPFKKCLCQYEIAPGFLVNIKNSSCDCNNKIVSRIPPTFITPQPKTTSSPTTVKSTSSCVCVDQIIGQGKVLLVNCSCENTNQNVIVLTRPSKSYRKRETKTENHSTSPKPNSNCECEEIEVMPGVLLKMNCECLRNEESSPISTTAESKLTVKRKMWNSQNVCSCDEFYPYPDMVLLYNCVCEVHLPTPTDEAKDSPQDDAVETNIPAPLITEFQTTSTGYQYTLPEHEGSCVCDEVGPSLGQVLRLNCTCHGNVASIFVVKDNNTVIKAKTTEQSNDRVNEETNSVSQSNRAVQNKSLTNTGRCDCRKAVEGKQTSTPGSETCNCTVGLVGDGSDVTMPATAEVTSPLTKNCSCDSVMPAKIFKVVRRHVPKEVSVVLCSCNLTDVDEERAAAVPTIVNTTFISVETTTTPESVTSSTPAASTLEALTDPAINTTSYLSTSVSVPVVEYEKKFWIRTIIRVESKDEANFSAALMEERLAVAYSQAFLLHHQEHLQINKRQRRQAAGIVTVQMIMSTPGPKEERELIYVVKSDGKPVSAKVAVEDMALLSTETMKNFLQHSVIVKAEEYIKEPTTPQTGATIISVTEARDSPGLSNDAVVILAVCLTLLILLLLLFLCWFLKGKKKERKRKYNQKKVFEETGGRITGPGDSKNEGAPPRRHPPSPRKPKKTPPQDRISLEADSSSSSAPESSKPIRKHKSRKDTSAASSTKKSKTKRKSTTRKSDLEASLDDSGLVIDSPDSHRSGQVLLSDEELKPRKKKKDKKLERIKPLDVLRNENFDSLSVTNAYFDYLNQPDVVAIGQRPTKRPKPGRLPPLKDDQYMQHLGLRQSLDYSPRPDVPNRTSRTPTPSRQVLPGFSDLGQMSTSGNGTKEPHPDSSKYRLRPVPKPRSGTKHEPELSQSISGQPTYGKPEMDELEAMLASKVAKTCPAEHLIRNIRQELQKFKTDIAEVDRIPS